MGKQQKRLSSKQSARSAETISSSQKAVESVSVDGKRVVVKNHCSNCGINTTILLTDKPLCFDCYEKEHGLPALLNMCRSLAINKRYHAQQGITPF